MVRKEKVPDNIIMEVLEDRKIQTIFWFIVTFAFKHKPYQIWFLAGYRTEHILKTPIWHVSTKYVPKSQNSVNIYGFRDILYFPAI